MTLSTELLSVIIPTLNEERHITDLLHDLNQQEDVHIEIVIADGGSTDKTTQLANTMYPAFRLKIVDCKSGRGRQMNDGFENSSGRYLLFIHADSQLTDVKQLRDALCFMQSQERADGTHNIAGRFGISFRVDCDDKANRYRYWQYKNQLGYRPYTVFGDQGLLISREYFSSLGGFSEEFPILEDVELVQRIASTGSLISLPSNLITSARRHEVEGFLNRGILNFLILAIYDSNRARLSNLLGDALYKNQHSTSTIYLCQYFRIVHSKFCRHGPFSAVPAWLGVARFTSKNVWRVFHLLDFFLRCPATPQGGACLRFYDKYLCWLICSRVVQVLLMCILVFIFYCLWGVSLILYVFNNSSKHQGK